MLNYTSIVRFQKATIDFLLFNKKILSSHGQIKNITNGFIITQNYKSLVPICSCKYVDRVNVRSNSSSSDPKQQKVAVNFENSRSKLFENSMSLENNIRVSNGDVDDKLNKIKSSQFKQFVSLSPQVLSRKCKDAVLYIDPYVKLMRIDKPIGTWLLFWPCGWSIMLAADPTIVPLSAVVQNLGLFLIGAFIMRGAGCTINDMWDKDIDAKVARTKSRPLVSGQISMRNATIFLAAQLSAGLAILLQLNWYSVILGASSMGLVVLYPLAKRVTDYPQLVLGLAFNWGALLGWSALRGSVDPLVCLPLYAAGVCWTLLYDTIYAHQDKKDDATIGIKSTALKFDKNTKPWLWANAGGLLAGLSVVGDVMNLGWPYYATLTLVGCHVSQQIWTLNPDNPEDCSIKFVSNSRVGLLIFLGILLGKKDAIAEYLKMNDDVDGKEQLNEKPIILNVN